MPAKKPLVCSPKSVNELANRSRVQVKPYDRPDVVNKAASVAPEVKPQAPRVPPLLARIRRNDTTGVQELFDGAKHPDPNMHDEHGTPVLMHAIDNDSISIVELLIRHGADLKATGSSGVTALLFSIELGHRDITRHLIVSGANIKHVNKKLKDGITPLMKAAIVGDVDTINALIDAGADLGITDAEGRIALDHATEHCNCEAEAALGDCLYSTHHNEILRASQSPSSPKTGLLSPMKGTIESRTEKHSIFVTSVASEDEADSQTGPKYSLRPAIQMVAK